jgi:predicted Zn-ribbon and HTH transcriptional regulator
MVDIKKCKQCNHTWTARTEYPRMCPRCKSYIWNQKKKSTLTIGGIEANKK